MEEKNWQISKRFYDYLCSKIGTEDVVRTRRRIYNALDSMKRFGYHQIFNSGSKAEGFDFKGSDIDIMYIYTDKPVYEFREEHAEIDKYPLVMDTDNTSPGFTRLKMTPAWFNYRAKQDLGKVDNGILYLSSQLVRRSIVKYPYIELTEHGPCATNLEQNTDITTGFHCKTWLTSAGEWITRSRINWPTSKIVRSAVKFGVSFVPVGRKGSKYEDLEFRISFSTSERMLVYSLNHVQFLCYALMKILLSDTLKKIHGEVLCSYFMKTIMFWICEETDTSEWIPERLLLCFMMCFKRLYYCVQHKTCLNFFIPEHDLFFKRFDAIQQRELLDTLQSLLSIGWEMLLQTETLSSFQFMFENNQHSFISSHSALQTTHHLNQIRLPQEKTDMNAEHVAHMMSLTLSIDDRETRILSTLQLNDDIVQYTSLSESDGNKQFYKQYKNCLSHLTMGTHNDAVCGWLMMASLFSNNKQYKSSLVVIDHCIEQFKPNKILIKEKVPDKAHIFFQENLRILNKIRRKPNFIAACKLFTVNDVLLFNISCLFPKELRGVIDDPVFRESLTGKSFHAVVLACFLKCNCYHNMKEEMLKRKAYDDIVDLALFLPGYLIPLGGFIHQYDSLCFTLLKDVMKLY